MNYLFHLGDILFTIETPCALRIREEELRFCYQNEVYSEHIYVKVLFVDELSRRILQEKYNDRTLTVGLDMWDREVREYKATFVSAALFYAASLFENDAITIWFISDKSLWENPNMYIWNFLHMETLLLRVKAFVLHCSYLMYEGKAILFSAPSGTGKTTQAKLWEKLYSARIINGDKAIVMNKGGVWYACGYPFHGSADECLNESYPIKAVVIVRQHSQDIIEEMRPVEKIKAIYSEATVPAWNPEAVKQALNLIGDLVDNVKVLRQKCTLHDNACHLLYHALNNSKE